MSRLFTAVWPPSPAVAELHGALVADDGWPPEGWRSIPLQRWHLTLCFHGEADPGILARRLETEAGGAEAPWLRLASSVSFAHVIAAEVHAEPGTGLAALVVAAGGDPGAYRPHVTVARTARRGDAPPRGGPLAGFVGSWWRPEEICLVRSELVSGGPRYTVLHRVPLQVDPALAARAEQPAAAETPHRAPTRCPGGL
ncbi:MAG: RNA 2',3'-cyclic phosphodiesterase [Actinomycetota bacterium]|nr:RNA 2',3'-cyclic phosphodiesterase [Actinomycetota bacterium]